MHQIKKQEENQIRSIKQMETWLEVEKVTSLSAYNTTLQLCDYEIYFRKNYFVRFNCISTKYERARLLVDEDSGSERLEWVELSVDELSNDLIRAGAKERGKLTEQEVARMLGDRRLVPQYNPILEYFNDVQNLTNDDDFDHIDHFASFLKVEGGEKEQIRWKTNFKKGLVRMVKCALDDMYFNKHAIILQSEDQSVGKTSYLRSICPTPLKKYYYEGALGIDKDSQTILASNFMINVDELANLARVEINTLKATLSKLSVKIRLPYAKTFQDFPRIATFWGTTNRNDFLTDSQNVRWIVFSVSSIDRSYGNVFTGEFNVDINKMWSQAYKLYKSGYACELSKEDVASNEDNNILYSATSLEKEVITTYFSPAANSDNGKKGFRKAQSSEIFEMACKFLEDDGRLHTLKNMRQNIFFSELARMNGWKKQSIRMNGRIVAGYYFIVNKDADQDNNQQNLF